MVTRARFERATPSFGGWCSIQLSYRATVDGRAADVGRREVGAPFGRGLPVEDCIASIADTIRSVRTLSGGTLPDLPHRAYAKMYGGA